MATDGNLVATDRTDWPALSRVARGRLCVHRTLVSEAIIDAQRIAFIEVYPISLLLL